MTVLNTIIICTVAVLISILTAGYFAFLGGYRFGLAVGLSLAYEIELNEGDITQTDNEAVLEHAIEIMEIEDGSFTRKILTNLQKIGRDHAIRKSL